MFPAEPIPDTIGSYKIVRRLPGAGGAELYLARSQGPMGFARECELKLMPDTSDGDASYAEQLAREAAICARLNNPAVVRVFDFFEHHGKLVLAIEHVEGHTLGELQQHVADKQQKLGDAAIFHIGARIASALADAHAARDEQGDATPIIHRNLSPETVLISVDGDVRLTGFGVGKILGRTPDTAIGRVKGTPGYMAPEQARGEPVTTKADIYGLGLLLWTLLAARRPPSDGTWPRAISGLRPDLPREVAAILDAALDHFPGTRKITAREIEQWLSKAAPAARGKAELRDKVAAMRAASGAKEEPPPPSSRRRIATVGSPYQGVRFGPPPKGQPSARRVGHDGGSRPQTPGPPEVKAGAPVSAGSASTSRGGAVARNLPPPPPAEPAAPVCFGAPPPDATPPPPPVAPVQEGPTLPSRGIVPSFAAPDAPAPTPPIAPVFTPPVALVVTPPPVSAPVLLAPVMLPAAAPGTPAPSSIRFGAPPPATPAPASVSFGAPPPVATPLPAPAAPAFRLDDPPPRRAPLPSLLTIRPGRRSLSAMGSALVSALTATLVVSVALYFFVHRDKPAASGAGASSSSPALIPAPAPLSSAASPPTASAVAGEGNPADLPYGYGYLTVVSPAVANVYVSGKLAGPVNKPLKVRCGRWFIRLAAPQEGRYPEWVSTGETVLVACQDSTKLDMGGRRP
jgi:eukaryotic-like serine/threonine-protein kinase